LKKSKRTKNLKRAKKSKGTTVEGVGVASPPSNSHMKHMNARYGNLPKMGCSTQMLNMGFYMAKPGEHITTCPPASASSKSAGGTKETGEATP